VRAANTVANLAKKWQNASGCFYGPPRMCVICLQVQNATNANIKEKHEADLKKEIKKLQV